MCTTVQATAFTVHISVSIICTLMNMRQFYILAKTKGFNDCLRKCALTDDGPMRFDISSTLRILKDCCVIFFNTLRTGDADLPF